MMDLQGIFPDGFHTQEDEFNKTMTGPARAFARTQYPRRYFIIDCLIGYQRDKFHDPFKADIYYAGNFIRTEFMRVGRAPSESVWLNVLLITLYTGKSITPGL